MPTIYFEFVVPGPPLSVNTKRRHEGMSIALQSANDQLLYEVAAGYMQKGFEVQIKPEANLLPEFLRGFSPDLIVKMPDGDSVVIHVKFSGNTYPADYWSTLQ